jgi:hypothetical protein
MMFDPLAFLDERWLWLGGSLLLGILWSNLRWLFQAVTDLQAEHHTSSVDRFVVRLASWRFSPAIFQVVRLLYYIAIPFVALLWGHDAVVGRLMGLQPLLLPTSEMAADVVAANWQDWAYDFGWAAVLGLVAWGLFALGGWTYWRALKRAGVEDVFLEADLPPWAALWKAVYHEVHWAFYRNAPAVALGPYWGTWVGLALVALEASLNPTWRDGIKHSRRGPALLIQAGLAVVSSVLFLRTQNIWMALMLHWGVLWGALALWRKEPSGAKVWAR